MRAWHTTIPGHALRAATLLAFVAWGGSACDSNRGSTSQQLTPEAAAGRQVFQRLACATCHSFDGTALAGPSLDDIVGRDVRLLDGSVVLRDDDYLRRSILDAGAQVVEGYRPSMIDYGSMLQDDELDQLLAWIRFHSSAEPRD